MLRHTVASTLFLACLVCLVPATASAQAAGGMESISAAVPTPQRFLYESGVCPSCTATDVTGTPRPQNLNPTGVSFSDCEQNLRMDFQLVASGFAPADAATVQTWAGTVDCSQDTNRVSTAGTPHACWQVAKIAGPLAASGSMTLTVSVFARDVLRYEVPSAASSAQPYDPAFNSSSAGESACHVQTTDAAVPIDLYFIPVNATGNAVGSVYKLSLHTDLVAPAPPCTVNAQGGSGLLDVAWTAPAADGDRGGFAVYSAAAGEGGCNAITANTLFVTGTSSEHACQRQGIAEVSPALLAGTVFDPTTTSFTQTGVHGGELYEAAVASVDGSGNVGPLSQSACAEPGGSSKVTAGCGCTAAGSSGSVGGLFALGALALGFASRRRREQGPVRELR